MAYIFGKSQREGISQVNLPFIVTVNPLKAENGVELNSL